MQGNYAERALKIAETNHSREESKEEKRRKVKEELMQEINKMLTSCLNGDSTWEFEQQKMIGNIECDLNILKDVSKELGIALTKTSTNLWMVEIPTVKAEQEMKWAQQKLTECIQNAEKNKERAEEAAMKDLDLVFHLVECKQKQVKIDKKEGEIFFEFPVDDIKTEKNKFYYSRINQILMENGLQPILINEKLWAFTVSLKK